MPPLRTPQLEILLKQLWTLLEIATNIATAADAIDQLEQVAVLCESAATTARAAAAMRADQLRGR